MKRRVKAKLVALRSWPLVPAFLSPVVRGGILHLKFLDQHPPPPPTNAPLLSLSSLISSSFRRSSGGEAGVLGASALFGGRLLTLMALAPFESVAV